MRTVIIKPLITEKSMSGVSERKYSFIVAKDANKTAIKLAVQKLFDVKVISVATSIVKGKRKKSGIRRREVEESIVKKAIVQVAKDQNISLFEPGGTEEPEKKKK